MKQNQTTVNFWVKLIAVLMCIISPGFAKGETIPSFNPNVRYASGFCIAQGELLDFCAEQIIKNINLDNIGIPWLIDMTDCGSYPVTLLFNINCHNEITNVNIACFSPEQRENVIKEMNRCLNLLNVDIKEYVPGQVQDMVFLIRIQLFGLYQIKDK